MEIMNQDANQDGDSGFTLIELLTVISIIAILAALILSTAGYVQRKAATSRAQTEIKAMEGACEGYKADNGTYPTDTSGSTTSLVAATRNGSASSGDFDPTQSQYLNSSRYLYGQLSGDTSFTGQSGTDAKIYMEFKSSMLGSTQSGQPVSASNKVTSIIDPFGFSYGYSSGTSGYNPTFDLWSTAGSTSISTSGTQAKWIKNW